MLCSHLQLALCRFHKKNGNLHKFCLLQIKCSYTQKHIRSFKYPINYLLCMSSNLQVLVPYMSRRFYRMPCRSCHLFINYVGHNKIFVENLLKSPYSIKFTLECILWATRYALIVEIKVLFFACQTRILILTGLAFRFARITDFLAVYEMIRRTAIQTSHIMWI